MNTRVTTAATTALMSPRVAINRGDPPLTALLVEEAAPHRTALKMMIAVCAGLMAYPGNAARLVHQAP